jgi:hypothetical protein
MYVGVVLRKGVRFRRIDVVFDRYRTQSIKSETRKKKSKFVQPIRRVIENRNVPLPSNLPSFLSLPENKEDLAFFLATELIRQSPEGKVVVTGGGFISEDQADSNDNSQNLDNLKATYEEADTSMILHMLHCKDVSNCRTIAVSATDTDVFLLLLHHAYRMDIKIWMMAGTSKSPKIKPIHSVLETNLPTRRMAQNLLAFHSITSCDTTSFFYGISKKNAYKVYEQDANLLEEIGEAELTDEKIKLDEAFICKLYNQVTDTSDEARDLMFGKSSPY